ncbi:MAG: hypothetical protein COA42_21260 [Alteromonadaceae bacterium]|nr:MAG: hypothetical protein COA42_21260 [Alteromonadaceae bacterium]
MNFCTKTLVVGLVLLFVPSPSFAANVTFDFLENDGVVGIYQYERNYEEDGLGVNITGWTTSELAGGAISPTLIGQEEVGQLPGRGLGVGRAPSFEVDNYMSKFDMLLFAFDDALVSLQSVSLGVVRHDSDLTIMSYQGGGFASFGDTFAGNTWEDLLGMGWAANGDYADVSLGGTDVNSQQQRSSYWLVGAFNENILGNNVLSTGDDYVKVASISVETPLPASFLMFASGMLFFTRSRRKAKQRK